MAFFDLFKKPYSPGDERLPKNRFRAYFDVMFGRYPKMLALSFLSFLFFLPFLALTVLKDVYAMSLPTDVPNDVLAYREATIAVAYALLSIPFLMLFFYGLGASAEATQKLVYQDPTVTAFSAFGDGLRRNYKSSLLGGFAFGLGFFLIYSGIYVYSSLEGFPLFLSIVLLVVSLFVTLYFFHLAMVLLTSGAVYAFSFKASLKNSAYLSLVSYFPGVLVFLLAFAFAIPVFLTNIWLLQGLFALLCLFYGFAHLNLVYCLYGDYVFDRYINKIHAPEEVDRGLDRRK